MHLNAKVNKVRLVSRLLVLLAVVTTIVTFGNSQPAHAASFTVTNTNNSGSGSLRQALIDANNNAGIDTITFNIPGSGPHVISPLTTYSSADGSQLGGGLDGSNAVIIDGCSQPGSDCSKFPLTLKVQIDGANLPATQNSIFNPAGINSVVKGLSITDSRSTPLYAAFSADRVTSGGRFVCLGGLTLQSNFLGIAPDGSAKGLISGIAPCVSGTLTFPSRIGGANPGQGNVIGSIANYGIATNTPIFGSGSTNDWIIEGNYFGLDHTGTQARLIGDGVGALDTAIAISGAYTDPVTQVSGVIIRNNKIANSTRGIFTYASSGVLIEDNEIVNNAVAGIYVAGAAKTTTGTGFPPNVVQTPFIIRENTITGTTGGPGIAILTTGAGFTGTPTGVTMQKNSIYSNSGLGIDLGNDGVTANGPAGVARSGANNLINYPVLTLVERGSIRITGTYAGIPNQAYTLDFYTSESGDSSGYGPGQTWVGSTDITTDATGNAPFHVTFNTTVPGGHVVSATATNATDGTSEFSAFQVMPDTPMAPPTTPSGSEGQLANTGENMVTVYSVAALLVTVGVAGILRAYSRLRV